LAKWLRWAGALAWWRAVSKLPFRYSRSFAPSLTNPTWAHLCSGIGSLDVSRSHKPSMLLTPNAT
jgi:hypothetical protein